jgi:FlaA1/EpsC-like NDP-sugar epimerase
VSIDLFAIGLSTFLGYLLRFNFSIPDLIKYQFMNGLLSHIGTALVAILITNSYKGIIRYTGIQDGVRIFYMLILNVFFISGLNLAYHYNFAFNLIPYSVIFISFLASFLFLFNYRLLVKHMFSYYRGAVIKNSNVLIYGAGQTGIVTKHVIDSTPTSRVIGFLDNDKNKVGKVLNGSKIFFGDLKEMEDLIIAYDVNEIIITIKDISIDKKNEIVDVCFKHEVRVRIVPPVEKWVRGELSLNQIKEINIEDLLERPTITLEDWNLERELKGKRICITGAAGSIGSEIVRQLAQYLPEQLILIDQAESPLYEIDRQIREQYSGKVLTFIADITDETRIRAIFRSHMPNIVFHAAAYKHVPMMESNPKEAVNCNILGTKNVADISVEVNVEKFVMISTDKSVNPTNVMGCSKRIAEIYVQSLNNHLVFSGKHSTAFVTTRFGNVLGSNGSVIPLFKKQIAQGGPVTVTHPEVTRFFMTIPESCRLVLEAAAMGKGGEIFIFDMGQSVKILDLARKMIQLSGLRPEKDVDIVFTGLREGEKLYEELLANNENTIATHHEKILIAKVREYSYDHVNEQTSKLKQLTEYGDELQIVAWMKGLVPEFRSNYSRYEVLDSQPPELRRTALSSTR